jgi:hypothetical protein
MVTYPGKMVFAYCSIPLCQLMSSSTAERYFEVPVYACKVDSQWRVQDTDKQLSKMTFKSVMWCTPATEV